MFFNYLKTAVRDLKKNRLFSAINIAGLGIGLAAFLVIIQFVLFERSYDNFHQNAADIYRIPFSWDPIAKSTIDQVYASNVPALGPALKNDFPEVKAYARLFDVHTIVPYCIITYVNEAGTKISFNEESGYYADPGFLTIFSFPLISGDAASALTEPKSVILSESMARRYFGTQNPVGKTLEVNNEEPSGSYTVKGVFADVPANSHLKFDFLFSYSSLGSGSVTKSWVWSQFYTYVQLVPGTDPRALERKLPAFLKKYNGPENGYEMFLQPLRDIHLTSHYRYEAELNGSERITNFLFIVAFLVLFIAWINYVNLASAKAMERAKEIGIRKAIGANKSQLFVQFIFQSFLTNAIACLVALGIILAGIPTILMRATDGVINFSTLARPDFWLIMAAALVVGAVTSGLYPAYIISSYEPVEVLKGQIKSSAGGLRLRRVLVVAQFAASVSLAISTLIIMRQFRFMQSQDLGIGITQTLVVKSPGIVNTTDQGMTGLFKDEVLKHPNVRAVAFSSSIPGKEITLTRGIKRRDGEPKGNNNFFLVGVDENFIDFYGIQLKEGRPFAKENLTVDKRNSVIVNEQALRELKYQPTDRVVNEKILISGKPPELNIVGVIKNYHNKSLEYPYEPIVLYLDSLNQGYFSLRINTATDARATLGSVEQTFKRVFPDAPFEYFFLDDFFNQQYQNEERNVRVFGAFCTIVILIACLGMIGLTTYSIVQRSKEIGVRKIMGANTLDVLLLLLKELFRSIAIASLIAWPLTYFLMGNWLNNYAFQVNVYWWHYLVPSLTIAAIAVSSVIYQIFITARKAPVKFIRNV
jgi:putative ABC transport system permease protein